VPLLDANTAPCYAVPGYLIFTRNEALLAQRFDAGSRRLIGDPFTIGDPPAQTNYGASPCATVSTNGVLAWQQAGGLESKLVWIDRAGHEIGTVGIAPERWSSLALSRDGRQAAMQQLVAGGSSDLWIVDLAREIANRITFGQGGNFPGAWSPDGKEIIYNSTRLGTRDLYRRSSDGSGTDQLFYRSSLPFKNVDDWSLDGKWVLFDEIGEGSGWNVMVAPAAGGAPRPLLASPFNEQSAAFSPDGAWIVYTSDESGSSQAYVQAFPGPGGKQQVSKTGAIYAPWSGNGREVFVLRVDFSVLSVPVDWAGSEPHFGAPRELYRLPPSARSWSPAPDGQRFLVVLPVEQTTPGVSIAVNWRAGAGR
jgi:hypothetical protein